MSDPSTLREFNPSENPVVDHIKAQADYLIGFIRKHCPDNREAAIAINNIEQGAMWAVKSNFT